MGTITGNEAKNAREAASNLPKDQVTVEEVKAAEAGGPEGHKEIPAGDPQEPVEILGETDEEKADRHIASTELPAADVTKPETQDNGFVAQDAGEMIVPGAAIGPDVAGVIRNEHGKVAYAPPGTLNAAMNGVQEDAAGHVDSIGTDNSSKSGVRI